MNTLTAKHFHLVDDVSIAAQIFAAIGRVEASMARISSGIQAWARHSNDRRLLTQMNERLLNDIGLSQIDVDRETAKSCWQK
jgi:uncharacterized protein YjiS (DUF1127 family)